jgi:pyruvate/2-oxoglutarate dehydrogenase complex dihydrolipoamide acyltransferase (E2) component
MRENFQVKVPQMGEGLQYAKVVRILKNAGDRVEEDDDVVEVETEKAILGISTPVAGVVAAVSCRAGDTVNVGAVLLEIGEGADVISLPQVRQERKGQRPAPGAAQRQLPAEQLALIDYMRQSRDIVIPASLDMQIGWDAIDRIKHACRAESPARVPSSTEIICWAAARAMHKFDKLKSRLSPDNQLQLSADSLIGIAVAGDDDRLETRVAAVGPHDSFDAAREKIVAALQNGAGGYHSLSVSDMSAFQVLRAQPVVVYPAVATLFIGAPHGDARETRVSNLVLAFDHRVMNGVYAAKFLKEIHTGIRHLAGHLQQQPEKGKENVTEHGT